MHSIARSSLSRSSLPSAPHTKRLFSALNSRVPRARERRHPNSHRPSAACRKHGFRTCSVSFSETHLSDLKSSELVLSDSQRRTIFALSTPPGKAGVAVVRISGPDALRVWREMVRTVSGKGKGKGKGTGRDDPEPWKMERCRIVDPLSEESLDDGLVVFFRGPRSFTTEDVLELHIHSGRAIISSILTALARLPFCRPAEPGEFTRRAFEGGRLDLTQVEGLKDLIDAETESQRKSALRAAGGATRIKFEELRQEIIKCLALVEALIDFGEGEEIEEGVFDQARDRAKSLRVKIDAILSDNRRGEIVRTGVRLAIFGPPNAGKSSLLNFLGTHRVLFAQLSNFDRSVLTLRTRTAQREAAIVTHIPGTTRDVLELSLDIGGLPVIVADTAGLRKTDDLVEAIGVSRAENAVKQADVSLLVLSLPELLQDTPAGPSLSIPLSISPLLTPQTFVLLNKSDLVPASLLSAVKKFINDTVPGAVSWSTSLASGEGTAHFLSGFAGALQTRYSLIQDQTSLDTPLITHARHRTHLESALRFLDAFLETDKPDGRATSEAAEDVVLGAEELRYAAWAVGKISGLIDVEDVLDVLFRDFASENDESERSLQNSCVQLFACIIAIWQNTKLVGT